MNRVEYLIYVFHVIWIVECQKEIINLGMITGGFFIFARTSFVSQFMQMSAIAGAKGEPIAKLSNWW